MSRDLETRSGRLRFAREAAGLDTAAAGALRSGVNTSTYRAHENGQNDFDDVQARAYARAFRVEASWLLWGDGQAPQASGDFAPVEDNSPEHIRSISPGAVPEFDIRAGAGAGGYSLPVAVIGDDHRTYDGAAIRAQWVFPPSFLRDELHLSLGTTDVIRIRGDSMDDGTIHGLRDGDRVIIDRKDRALRQGGIFAVVVGDEVIVKRVIIVPRSDPARILCKSLNSGYPDQEYILDEEAHIVGRVAAAISRR